MVELFSKDDYKIKVTDNYISNYLESSFKRYPADFEFGALSSFIVLDDVSELNKPIKLTNNTIIPPITDEKFTDMISMLDGDENVIDIVLLFSDFGEGVSIIIGKEQLSSELLDILYDNGYKY